MVNKILNSTVVSSEINTATNVINNASDHLKNDSFTNRINLKHITLNSGAVLRGFYLFVGLSVLVVLYIAYRGLRLRRSRIERRYGTNKTNDTQELTPLPVGVTCDDDDSEGEDHTVFELQHISNRN